MKILRSIVSVLFMIVIVLSIVIGIIYTSWTRAPLPSHGGEIRVNGLSDKVEIFRDSWGVPHIYASNTYDLFFAQGYTQAQDRWWQMEFTRHIGSGRISEIVGKQELGTDLFIRVSGWQRAAEQDFEQLDRDVQEVLQAFTDGVNAYIEDRDPNELALEYSVFDLTDSLAITDANMQVEPWTPVDTLVFTKILSWNLSGNRSVELLFSEMLDSLGEEMVLDYFQLYPFNDKPTILQDEDLPLSSRSLGSAESPMTFAGITGIETQLAGNFDPNRGLIFGSGDGIGSNNWVVHGDRTVTGEPLLANDPHLDVQMPSIWYEIGLHCQPVSNDCPYNVVGFALSSAPGIIIGHNDDIAWGVTNVNPDTQDLYMLRINPENDFQYEWNGRWRDMDVHEESFRIAGEDEVVTIQVRETHLGPIITDHQLPEEEGDDSEEEEQDEDNDLMLTGFNNAEPMALRWTALEPSTLAKAVLMLNRASNWREFREALRFWDSPSQNFVYADTDGNIGYQIPGNIPIRARGHNGILPIDGTSSQTEWLGFVPFDNLPRILNPPRDWIASANHAPVPREFYQQLATILGNQFDPNAEYTFSFFWAYGYRGERINELLEDTRQHSIESFQNMQGDNKLISAEEIMPFLENVKINDRELNDVRDWLMDWNFQMDMDSPQAALYANFWAALMDNLYEDQLGDMADASGGSRQMWATRVLANEPNNIWWDDIRTDNRIETRDDILLISLEEGYEATVEALGENREDWEWGKLHTTTFVNNPLGQSGVSPIESIFNRGPVQTGGAQATINATSWNASSGEFEVRASPSMRMIIDLDDFSNSVAMNTTGQSGHPASGHYGDMIDEWSRVEYHPMLWTREEIEQAAASKLVLTP